MDGFLFAIFLCMCVCLVFFMKLTCDDMAKMDKEIRKIETVLIMKGLSPKELFEKEKK